MLRHIIIIITFLFKISERFVTYYPKASLAVYIVRLSFLRSLKKIVFLFDLRLCFVVVACIIDKNSVTCTHVYLVVIWS